jgi:hypothetical protein
MKKMINDENKDCNIRESASYNPLEHCTVKNRDRFSRSKKGGKRSASKVVMTAFNIDPFLSPKKNSSTVSRVKNTVEKIESLQKQNSPLSTPKSSKLASNNTPKIAESAELSPVNDEITTINEYNVDCEENRDGVTNIQQINVNENRTDEFKIEKIDQNDLESEYTQNAKSSIISDIQSFTEVLNSNEIVDTTFGKNNNSNNQNENIKNIQSIGRKSVEATVVAKVKMEVNEEKEDHQQLEGKIKQKQTKPKSESFVLFTPQKDTKKTNKSLGSMTCRTPSTSTKKTAYSSSLTTSTTSKINKNLYATSKINNTIEKSKQILALKEDWNKKKQEKLVQNKEKKILFISERKKEQIALEELRKKNAIKEKEILEKQRKEKADLLAASIGERIQLAIDLENKQKAKRRISVFLNNKMHAFAKKKENLLLQQQKQYELDLLETKRLNYLDVREAKKEAKEKNRESLIFRANESKKIKNITLKLQDEKNNNEKTSILMRKENYYTEKNYKILNNIKEKKNLLLDIQNFKKYKDYKQDINEQKNFENNLSISLRYEDWKSLQQYKENEKKLKRVSLQCRLDKWREEKEFDATMKIKQEEVDEMEKKIKMQEVEDVKRYKETIKQKRRKSLVFRLEEAKRHENYEKGNIYKLNYNII